MNRRAFGMLLIGAGTLLALVGLLADALGVGTYPGMGSTQIAMLVVGLASVVVGVLLLRRGGGPPPSDLGPTS